MSQSINYGLNISGTRTLSITSGKGGVGKSTIVANTAMELARMGKRVVILDGDLGMANIDIMFGVRPTKSLADVMNGTASIQEVIMEIGRNLYLIPGGSGIYGLNKLDAFKKQIILEQVNALEGLYDYLIIDTAPGIDDSVLYLNSAVQDCMVVVTPDPSSITDSYALIKVLNAKYDESNFSIICNMVSCEEEAIQIYKRLCDVADKFLCVSLDFKGFIPIDDELRNATRAQQLILKMSPRCPSSYGLRMLSQSFSQTKNIGQYKGGMQFFFEQLVGVA